MGALEGLNFVQVKLPKLLEASRCFSMFCVVYGIVSNAILGINLCVRIHNSKFDCTYRRLSLGGSP